MWKTMSKSDVQLNTVASEFCFIAVLYNYESRYFIYVKVNY